MTEKNKGGRPTNYTPELVAKAWAYIDKFTDPEKKEESETLVPSVVGLCAELDRARATMYAWAGDKDKEFSDILDKIEEIQELTLVNKGLSGETNPTITKLMLHKHGYSDKQDIGHTGNLIIERVSHAAAKNTDTE